MSASKQPNLVEILKLRASWLRSIREFFDSRDFIEVQTPVLSRDTVVDRYIDPISVNIPVQGIGTRKFWLQTSPEFCMKRLLASGAKAIYEMTPAFRAGETGPRHNIEFTMLEWYRVGDDYAAGMDLLDQFSQTLLNQKPAHRMTYREAFLRFANIDLFEPDSKNRARTLDDEQLNELMVEQIEPGLSTLGAVIIFDWPASQAALAKTRVDEIEGKTFEVAERFELYVDGIELANGYHELTDPKELLQRNQNVNRLRKLDGKPSLPESSRLIAAMKNGFPDCCGVALGFDRMLMLATGAESIDDVLPIPGAKA